MKALWIHDDMAGSAAVRPLPLPYRRITKPIDPEIFRRQARGEDVGRPRLHPTTGLSSRRTVGRHEDRGPVTRGRGLVLVISGQVELWAGGRSLGIARPGDVYLQDQGAGQAHTAVCNGDCSLLFLGLESGWQPSGEVQTRASEDRPPDRSAPLLRRMYEAADGKSLFGGFPELFGPSGEWTPPRPAQGFHFVHFPPGFFIDWHPEGVNNFVVINSGALELEVSGDRRVEVFGPGDVCLAEDRTGEGHIDRAHGENRMVLVVLDNEHLWERTS
jgi:hypothetical protein